MGFGWQDIGSISVLSTVRDMIVEAHYYGAMTLLFPLKVNKGVYLFLQARLRTTSTTGEVPVGGRCLSSVLAHVVSVSDHIERIIRLTTPCGRRPPA